MDVADFEYILTQIPDLISLKHRLGGTDPIKCDEGLAITLRYLATGESFKSLSYQFRISLNAVSYIVKGCCKAIVERMALAFIKVPSTKAEWLDISRKFEERWNFPHALEAIDGKHIRIQKPKNGGSFYYNYKHTHSIILMAIADPEYECLYADVSSNGRVNDSGIWKKSSLLQGIQNGSIEIPDDEKLSNGDITAYVFLGDDAFALTLGYRIIVHVRLFFSAKFPLCMILNRYCTIIYSGQNFSPLRLFCTVRFRGGFRVSQVSRDD